MIGYWNGYETYGNMGMGGFGIVGFLVMFVFWILIIALVVLLVKRLAKDGNILSNNTNGRALETLKERYANGEIDTKEYNERKEVLLKK